MPCGTRSIRNFNGSDGRSGGQGGGNNKLPPLGSSSASSSDDGEKKSGNILAIFWAAYISLLDTQPILTKSLTSMTGFALGDLLAQKFIEKKVQIDPFVTSHEPLKICCIHQRGEMRLFSLFSPVYSTMAIDPTFGILVQQLCSTFDFFCWIARNWRCHPPGSC